MIAATASDTQLVDDPDADERLEAPISRDDDPRLATGGEDRTAYGGSGGVVLLLSSEPPFS